MGINERNSFSPYPYIVTRLYKYGDKKMEGESTTGFVLRLQAKKQAGVELGLRELLYLKSAKRVKRREGNK